MNVNTNSDKTVLIVEDDFASAQFFIELLSEFDVNILTSDNGSSTFEILKVHDVDLVLLDIKLPDTTGFEIIKEIRNLYGDKVKVIAQTANAYRECSYYENAGFDGYLLKPICTNDFKSLVVNLLSC